MRHDIIHFLDFVYNNDVGLDYKDKFREYWAPKGPSYGLSRCMPWGAFTLICVTEIIHETLIDTTYDSILLVKDNLKLRYVKIGDMYYTFAYEFYEMGEEYDARIYNALLCVISNGTLKYKGGTL